jgi:8-oxo-dGTP diphosphatase
MKRAERDQPEADPVRTLVSVGWVHIRRRRLLAVRSAASDRFYLPGGKPEAGETLEEALEREIREELAIDLVHVQLLFTVTAPAYGLQPPTALTMHCYGGDPRGRPQPGGEIAELAWLGPNDKRAAPAVSSVLSQLWVAGLIA